MAMIGINVMAEATEITILPTDFEAATSANYSTEKDGVTVSVTASTVTNDQLRIFKNQTITISSTVGNMTKVVFTCTANGTAKYGPGCFEEHEGYTFEANGKVGTWEGDAASLTLKASSDQVRVTEIVVTIGEGGGSSKTATSIDFSGNYLTKFTQGKDGNSADLPTATVKAGDKAVDGATVTWSLIKGSNWKADSDPTIDGNKIVFGDHSCGELTVKAAFEGNDNYEASNKTYTLNAYKGYMAIKSILEDYPVVGGDSWKGKEAEWKAGYLVSYWQVDNNLTSKEALVTYVNGMYTYIKDDEGCLLLYGNNLGFKQGDKISGDLGNNKMGAIYGTLKAYNGLLELQTTANDIEFVVKSSDNTVEPKTITIDKLTQENMNEYVQIFNAEFVEANSKNLTFKVGETTLAVYNQFGVDVESLAVGEKYALTGFASIYYKNEVVNNQLYLVDFTKYDPSGINNVRANKFQGAIYNLRGQRVMTPAKGLYIRDGKKFFVK